MKGASTVVRSVWGIVYATAGIGFFFSIIGVFGLRGAVLSLLLYVPLSIALILKTRRTES